MISICKDSSLTRQTNRFCHLLCASGVRLKDLEDGTLEGGRWVARTLVEMKSNDEKTPKNRDQPPNDMIIVIVRTFKTSTMSSNNR